MPCLALAAPVVIVVLAACPAAGAFAQNGDRSGKELFTSAEPACSICHTLEEAGATGRIGPNLDTLRPTAEQVRNAMRDGPGSMPAYETLSAAEIDAVAEYVAEAAGR